MSSHVGVYLDSEGNVACIVRPHFDVPNHIVTEKDFEAHQYPGLTRVNVPTLVYEGKPPILRDGKPFYYDLAKAIVADVAKADRVIADKLQAKVDVVKAEIDAKIAEAEAAAKEEAAAVKGV